MSNELIRTWTRDSYRIELSDTGQVNRLGKAHLEYRLYDSRVDAEPIFEGQDFYASPLHATDSDATLAAVLSFLSLAPGDTDAEYFDDYTLKQLSWCQDRAADLGMIAQDMDSALTQSREQGSREPLAVWIDLGDGGTLDTVFEVFDVVTGEAWTERFSSDAVERGDDGEPTAEAIEYVRETAEESAQERRDGDGNKA